MERGDISNESPPRVLVHLDVVVQRKPEISKVLGIIPVMKMIQSYDPMALNRLWLFTSRNSVNLELFDVGCSKEDMDQVYEEIDSAGTNPFRWVSAHRSNQTLVSSLAYRPEVIGVVDIPERAFRYGSKYFDLERV